MVARLTLLLWLAAGCFAQPLRIVSTAPSVTETLYALGLGDRVVVMNEGRIQQIADPHTIYTRPVNVFVAKFIGEANLLEATLLGRDGAICELEIIPEEGRAPLHLRATGGDGAARGGKVF